MKNNKMSQNSVKGYIVFSKMLINCLLQWKHLPTDEALENTRTNNNNNNEVSTLMFNIVNRHL